MPPIKMTVSERAALRRLAVSPRLASEIHPDLAEKFLTEGLVERQALRLTITTRGQIELLRQRYRTLSKGRVAALFGGPVVTKRDEQLATGLPEPGHPEAGIEPD